MIRRRQLIGGLALPFLAGWGRAFAKPLPEILSIARDAPPRCVQGLKTTFAAEMTRVPAAIFRVTCEHCSGEAFSVFERKVDWGKGVTSTGVGLQCSKCSARTDLFDMRRDGYDGELGHNNFIQGAQSEEPLKSANGREFGDVKVRVAFTYNIELDELQGDAREAHKRPQDLFDWFTLDVNPGTRWIEEAWDCECA